MNDEKYAGSDSSHICARIDYALESVGASQSGRDLAELVRRAVSLDDFADFEEWGRALSSVTTSSFSVDELSRFVLLLSEVVPDELLRDLLRERDGAWQQCAEILVSDSKAGTGVCRILRYDLLYSYWRHRVEAVFEERGIEPVIDLVKEEMFFESEEGRSIAQDALLNIVRERLRGRLNDLRHLQASFPNMNALSRKVNELVLLAAEPKRK